MKGDSVISRQKAYNIVVVIFETPLCKIVFEVTDLVERTLDVALEK